MRFKKFIRSAAIAIILLIVCWFGGKRIFYANQAFFYNHTPFRYYTPVFKKWDGFISSPQISHEIIFVGTSITYIFPLQQAFHDRHIKNLGFGGNFTVSMLYQVKYYVKRHPEKIFLEAGINEIKRNVNADSILKNVAAIALSIKTSSPATKLYIQSVLPTNEPLLYSGIINYNRKLAVFCKVNQIVYINLYPLFVKNGFINEKLTSDGIHPNIAGYRVWATAIRPYLCQ